MQYLSTRDKTLRLRAAGAMAIGLSRDGGLFAPEAFPDLGTLDLKVLGAMSYQQRASFIMGKYLEAFGTEELERFAQRAYGPDRFDHPDVAPLHRVDSNTWCLELWHGPTCAFKDLALQMLPQLISESLNKLGEERDACILVATSGDTGKAALEGFADVPRTKILVFYPEHGVSEMQRLQMVTQSGDNVGVCAVRGNFDDAQGGVKALFSDEALREVLREKGWFLSSANSINWGRILPQIVYYISAYCDLLGAGEIKLGQKVNFCVPTGNFGNILSCYYAKRMGLPVGKLICASNRNDVLTDFIRTGIYDRNRPFHTTMSPSMDILISSNLERLLFDMSGGKDELVREYMEQLAQTGRYEVTPGMKRRMQEVFYGGFCGEEETASSIAMLYRYGYLIDTHTAVAAKVLTDYRKKSGDRTPAIFVSTASPYKFCDSVLSSIGQVPVENSVERIAQMVDITGVAAPVRLAGLKGKEIRFRDVTGMELMEEKVLSFLE